MITIAIQRPWHVKTPPLVRYMDRQYVEEFFDTGRLRLSSFTEFAKHRDEERLDAKEGMTILTGIAADQTVFAVTKHGVRSYILCTSAVESPDLQAAFGADGGFRIKDSTAFGVAIASVLPGFVEGLEGHCIYQDERVIEREINSLDLEALQRDPNSLQTVAAHAFRIGGADVFFVKLRKYSAQAEYRFVWNVSYDVTVPLIVECPDARQFCEHLV